MDAARLIRVHEYHRYQHRQCYGDDENDDDDGVEDDDRKNACGSMEYAKAYHQDW
eukprot:CAMPEP_0202704652 /NCGR_PEP_ID=MMETSP1385-20130828/17305_1 /ASSEMBLY_ACC=CAM_ASM_000861 /TAXON_ID=933848 /ORGANISM="Elphidium margaritaceum" /LENGTH=54 /DNA_ID=CAMNT_0049362731 /DNA_START=1181 /DNA_END=1342 /DNA_ORIENTATION=-